MDPIHFTAGVVRGAGRGKDLGTPTLNLNLDEVPPILEDGIYACRAQLTDETGFEAAVLHIGPRPVFQDDRSCEVHLLDRHVDDPPPMVAVKIVAFLREVRNFPSVEEMVSQIEQDIVAARAILEKTGNSSGSRSRE